jgi:hypothetical protein
VKRRARRIASDQGWHQEGRGLVLCGNGEGAWRWILLMHTWPYQNRPFEIEPQACDLISRVAVWGTYGQEHRMAKNGLNA